MGELVVSASLLMKRIARQSSRALIPRNSRAALSAAMFGAVLSGCSLSTPPTHQSIVKDALPSATTMPSTWTSKTASEGEVSAHWLESFNDPALDAIVAEAIANNLDLKQAAAHVIVAREHVVIVAAQLKPMVGVKLGADTLYDFDASDQHGSTMAFAGVSWEIDVWGRLRSQRDAAQAEFQATELDFAFARQSLAATVAKAWYVTIETRQLLELAQQYVTVYTKLLDLVKIRRAAGKVDDLDVAEASAALNAAQDQLHRVQNQYSEVRRDLEVLLGRYPAAELSVADRFTPLPPPVGPGVPSALLERRPDVIAAEYQVIAAFRLQEAAKLALLPSFALTLEGGRLSDSLLSILSLNPWLIHGGIGVTVPIYEGGALQARVKIATAQQEEVVARYGKIMLTSFREVENALTNESILAERIGNERDALNNRTAAVRIANEKYKAGRIDLLSLLQLQADQFASEEQVIRLGGAQLVNRIDLHLALGGDFGPAHPEAVVPVSDAAMSTGQ